MKDSVSNKRLIAIVTLLVLTGGLLYYSLFTERTLEISSEASPAAVEGASPLAKEGCKNYRKRPYAVMMPADEKARPLSAISSAEFVVEMPVVKDKITRLMPIFACSEPKEIGAVRSARHDFIPLAAGFDAIFVHWGGSNFALDKLKEGVVDNIDALINPQNTFYRKKGAPRPHNGFTSYTYLKNRGTTFYNYRTTTNFEGYPRISHDDYGNNDDNNKTDAVYNISIGYPEPYNVSYKYNKKTNFYTRFRGGRPEIDKLNGKQVKTKVALVVKTTSRQINTQYNDVDIAGTGDALIFQNGKMQKATWKKPKKPIDSKLKFVNNEDKEIPLVPGKVWIHIVDKDTKVTGESL